MIHANDLNWMGHCHHKMILAVPINMTHLVRQVPCIHCKQKARYMIRQIVFYILKMNLKNYP